MGRSVRRARDGSRSRAGAAWNVAGRARRPRKLLQDEGSVMDEVRPQSGTIREGLLPHRWTRVEDPDSVAVVAAYEAIIAGGGPAGLTAAYELSKHGKPCVVLEADPRMEIGRAHV